VEIIHIIVGKGSVLLVVSEELLSEGLLHGEIEFPRLMEKNPFIDNSLISKILYTCAKFSNFKSFSS
jgi:hypothetical protein